MTFEVILYDREGHDSHLHEYTVYNVYFMCVCLVSRGGLYL